MEEWWKNNGEKLAHDIIQQFDSCRGCDDAGSVFDGCESCYSQDMPVLKELLMNVYKAGYEQGEIDTNDDWHMNTGI